MLNQIILLKGPYISLIIDYTLSLLPLTPSSMSSGAVLLQRPYISFSSPLLLILRQEITAAAAALFLPHLDSMETQVHTRCLCDIHMLL